jgi:hypothetical protein
LIDLVAVTLDPRGERGLAAVREHQTFDVFSA